MTEARQFILDKIKLLNIKPQFFQFVHENLTNKEKKILQKLKEEKLKKNEEKDPQKFLQEFNINPIDGNIQKHKLLEVSRNKQLLEQRLQETYILMNMMQIPQEIEKEVQLLSKQNQCQQLFYKKALCNPTPLEAETEKKKNEKASEFAKQMVEKSKQLLKVRKAEMKRIREKIKRQLEKSKKIVENKREKELEERRQKLEQQFQKIQSERDQRKEEIAKCDEEYKQKLKDKPLYQKIEEKFNKTKEMTELEKRKAMLAAKRQDFFKIKDLNLRSHDEIQKERERIQKLRQLRKQEFKHVQKTMESFQLNGYDYLEFEDEFQSQYEQNQLEKRLIQERIHEYDKQVKTSIQIKTNKKKAKELEDLKQKLKHPVRQSDPQIAKENATKFMKEEFKKLVQKPKKKIRYNLLAITPETPKLNYTMFDKQIKTLQNEKKFQNENFQLFETPKSQVYDKQMRRQQRYKEKEKELKKIELQKMLKERERLKKEEELKKPKYFNYLEDQEIQKRIPKTQRELNYENIITKQELSEQQKLEIIKKKASQLEEEARRQELKLGGSIDLKQSRDVLTNELVNNLYLNSVKAKLAVLEQFSL